MRPENFENESRSRGRGAEAARDPSTRAERGNAERRSTVDSDGRRGGDHEVDYSVNTREGKRDMGKR